MAMGIAQQSRLGVVLAEGDQEPVEFVSVYNEKDHSMTNADGQFAFVTQLDSVFFYAPGYQNLRTTVGELRDTVYLKRSIVNLEEVVVTNAKSILERIRDSLTENYHFLPHVETFFIRALLRRNDTIVRLQDMQGNLKRKTLIYTGDLNLEKKDYAVELLQMRQVGINKDANDVYFIFPSFYSIFSEFVRINAMGPDFKVVEKPLADTKEIRVDFASGNMDGPSNTSGHYIINALDNAILSFTVTHNIKIPKTVLQQPEYHRTVLLKSATYFKKDRVYDRYFMNYAKQVSKVRSKRKGQKEPTEFQIEIILHTTNPFADFDVKSNVNEQKDLFKLKAVYNKDFWESQNQLLLTKEMEKFITTQGTGNTQFKGRTNLN